MKIAGFDIGGANTDLAVIDFKGDEIKNIEVNFAYLPMWSNNNDLSQVLINLIEKICPISEIEYDIMEKRLDVEKNILFAEVRGQSVDLVAADDQPRRM